MSLSIRDKIQEIARLYQDRGNKEFGKVPLRLSRIDFEAQFALANADSACLQTLENGFGKVCIEENHKRYFDESEAFIEQYLYIHSPIAVAYPSYRIYQSMADEMFLISLKYLDSTETYSDECNYAKDIQEVIAKYRIFLGSAPVL